MSYHNYTVSCDIFVRPNILKIRATKVYPADSERNKSQIHYVKFGQVFTLSLAKGMSMSDPYYLNIKTDKDNLRVKLSNHICTDVDVATLAKRLTQAFWCLLKESQFQITSDESNVGNGLFKHADEFVCIHYSDDTPEKWSITFLQLSDVKAIEKKGSSRIIRTNLGIDIRTLPDEAISYIHDLLYEPESDDEGWISF